MSEIAFCSIDTETTGLARTCKLVEICILAWDAEGNVVQQYLQRINPGIPIPSPASAVHGIYDRDVENMPSFDDVAADIVKALEWTIPSGASSSEPGNIWDASPFNDASQRLPLVGHNIVSYDIPILRAHFEAAQIAMPLINPVDTLKLARARWPKHPDGNKLITCCARMGIQELNDSHGAYADSFVNGKLFQRLQTGLEYDPTPESVAAKKQLTERLETVNDILGDFDFG